LSENEDEHEDEREQAEGAAMRSPYLDEKVQV
jgi:hypothetical protein